MGGDALERLRECVVDDPEMCRRLASRTDERSFVAEVVAVAAELALDVGADDVTEGLVRARQEQLSRWV